LLQAARNSPNTRLVFESGDSDEPDCVVVDTTLVTAALLHVDTPLALMAFALLCWCDLRLAVLMIFFVLFSCQLYLF
jgi:hypothetical protein